MNSKVTQMHQDITSKLMDIRTDLGKRINEMQGQVWEQLGKKATQEEVKQIGSESKSELNSIKQLVNGRSS